MRKQWAILLLILFSVHFVCRAEEGMWIPMLLKKYNIEDMQKQGFKLTAEDIYEINQASLKDAVIGLGREGRPFQHFCTGELVSNEGLMITNHHCSFGMIQSHTTLEKNYLRDGFWAKNKGEELANPGTTASVLVRMEDVTEQINSNLTDGMTASERAKKIAEVSEQLEQKAVEGTNLQASIKPYFNGNQFFMSVFKIYKDVRLVGAPPSAIGKFGGDTDNWMWPRHTGDFSILRIYADENNEPAEYSASNKPYVPASFFKISTKGIYENDFTMVFGYPGTTAEYLTSFAIQQVAEVENPHKIAIRTAKLNIINVAMESDELLRIKYAAKAANIANSWKKWQGENKGLKRFKTIEKKQKTEADFTNWATGNSKYSGLVDRYKTLYGEREDLILAAAYATEAGKRGAEIVEFAGDLQKIVANRDSGIDLEQFKAILKDRSATFYKDYDLSTDKKILTEMLKLYNANLPKSWRPEMVVRAEGNCGEFVSKLFAQSVFTDLLRLNKFIEKSDEKSLSKLDKDPMVMLANSIILFDAEKIKPRLSMIEKELVELDRLWLAGLMEMNAEKVFYPDANSTLRVAYGKIGGYSPMDGVNYKHYTTLNGIIEKDNPAIYDYDVPQELREIYATRDFGKYTQDGEVPVCFVASNHTTGGNSGSPVLNADGHLIGVNFDRAWDGVMSDLQYDADICRNIAVDIRYVLFIVDKLGKANHLIEEMDIVD